VGCEFPVRRPEQIIRQGRLLLFLVRARRPGSGSPVICCARATSHSVAQLNGVIAIKLPHRPAGGLSDYVAALAALSRRFPAGHHRWAIALSRAYGRRYGCTCRVALANCALFTVRAKIWIGPPPPPPPPPTCGAAKVMLSAVSPSCRGETERTVCVVSPCLSHDNSTRLPACAGDVRDIFAVT
jgi:hypothetical protein